MKLRTLLTCAVVMVAAGAMASGPMRMWYAKAPQAAAPSGPVYATNLLVWYEFASAGTLLTDSSGNGRDAVQSNGVLVAVADGASFTNKPYMTLPNSCIVSNNGTIAYRVYLSAITANDLIYSIAAGSTNKMYSQMLSSKIDFSGPGWVLQSAALPNNVWFDFVGTWSTNAGVGVAFYLASNNTAIAVIGTDTIITDAAGLNRFRVGDYTTLGYPLTGIMRDFRVYDRRMTGTEVTNIVLDMRP